MAMKDQITPNILRSPFDAHFSKGTGGRDEILARRKKYDVYLEQCKIMYNLSMTFHYPRLVWVKIKVDN